ncbi:MAG: DNA primase [Proteobacteria bacterium]|nr:DNA primase [Pseudomonadota bacterium]
MSGRIPQHFIDDLIARADIVEVLGRRIQLKKAGREFKAVCPFHDEKTPSFTVSPAKGFYHCFGCGAHGTALGFLMDYDHMSFVDAVESLAGMIGIEVPHEEGQRPAQRFDELFELTQKVERHFQHELRDNDKAVAYLKQRGIDGATAQRFGIGYAAAGWSRVLDKFGTSAEMIERLLAVGLIIRKDNGKHYDRFRDRIMFPIRDSRGRCIGFGGRVLGNDEPKYLNSPETVLFHKGRELYGLYEARQALRHIDRLVVVEGYMDVVGLARNGIDFAVATLGTATTNDHLQRLFRLTDYVIFCFDGDRAGRDAAWRALQNTLPLIEEGRQVRFVFLPDKQDPDSFVRENGTAAFEQALQEGVALSDYLVRELSSGVDLASVDGRARLAELARPLLRLVPAGVYRELLLQTLAESVGLSAFKLEALLTAGSEGKDNKMRGKAARHTHRATRMTGVGKPSVLRRAITLLLHYPQAAQDLDVEKLADLQRPGAGLLRDLIENVQAEPGITTAGILERWRHHADGQHLSKLATIEVPFDEEFDAAAELAECLQQLARVAARERIDFLIGKERLDNLSVDEKAELRALGNNPVKPHIAMD